MKNRLFIVMLLAVLLVSFTGNASATSALPYNPTALVFISITSGDDLARFAQANLPMFTRLDGGLLAGADKNGQQALAGAGLTYQVLDPDLSSGTYYLAQAAPGQTAPNFSSFGQVLLTTSHGVLLKMDPTKVGSLTRAGVELRLVTLTPKPLPEFKPQPVSPAAIEPDPVIQGMINQVTATQVYTYDRQLAGELPVWVDDDWYTITSRYTYSGTPIQKATSYVGQHMQDLGLDVEYHNWGGSDYPNVIGQITGSTNPNDIYMIGAHIDDVGYPGADDNASGSVATLLAADILSQYDWGCTLRFAFWTGEEQGLVGSYYYAQRAYQQGENILGYLNLDMIAWNTIGSAPYINLFYSSGIPESQQLAQLFADVIGAYGISLQYEIGADAWGSDHNSFWDYGFNSILAIEDETDFNPYYHGPQDTPAHTDQSYFTNFTRASIGTFAHMTGCLIPSQDGTLDGTVTTADNGLPVEGLTVIAEDDQGTTYPAITDAAGYYTVQLPAGTYTVTAALDGYEPQSQVAEILPNQTTTVDFALQPLCDPVSNLFFAWWPSNPDNGELITFGAAADGTPPIDFQWTFGDTFTGTGATVDHAYSDPGTYTVTLSAANTCGSDTLSHDIIVSQHIMDIFLPLLKR